MYSTQSWAPSDEVALAEARSGNPEGFRVLVERHSRGVYRVAFRMTGNEQDAEDLVQETFLRACKQLDRFDGRSNYSTWLYRIATNCAVDLLRARGVRQRRTADLGDCELNPLEQIAANTPSPERLSLSSEIGRLLQPAMGQLSAMEKAAFVLRHYEGMTMEEIGAVLDVRPNAAKHSIFRAVQKLRRVLEPALGGKTTRVTP